MGLETGATQNSRTAIKTTWGSDKAAWGVLLWPLDDEEAEEATTVIDERGDDITERMQVITRVDPDTVMRSIRFPALEGGWLVVRRAEKLYKVWRVNVDEGGQPIHYEARTRATQHGNAGTMGLPAALCAEMEAAGL